MFLFMFQTVQARRLVLCTTKGWPSEGLYNVYSTEFVFALPLAALASNRPSLT